LELQSVFVHEPISIIIRQDTHDKGEGSRRRSMHVESSGHWNALGPIKTRARYVVRSRRAGGRFRDCGRAAKGRDRGNVVADGAIASGLVSDGKLS
jgi:hypothetical protein